MIKHIETIAFTSTNPTASGAAAVAVPGDSLTMKYGTNPRIIQAACDFQAAGFLQITYPTAHDTTRGYRVRVNNSEPTSRMVMGLEMPITTQETMSITVAAADAAGDIENGILTVAYDNVPGSMQNLASWSEVVRRMQKLTTVDLTITPTVGGAWTGSEAINADSDLLIANREYAVLGIEFQTECAAMSLKGPDTAGIRVAVPGSVEFNDQSANYFAYLSRAFMDATTIPVINSANKNNTLIEVLVDENLGSVFATLMLALLSK